MLVCDGRSVRTKERLRGQKIAGLLGTTLRVKLPAVVVVIISLVHCQRHFSGHLQSTVRAVHLQYSIVQYSSVHRINYVVVLIG